MAWYYVKVNCYLLSEENNKNHHQKILLSMIAQLQVLSDELNQKIV